MELDRCGKIGTVVVPDDEEIVFKQFNLTSLVTLMKVGYRNCFDLKTLATVAPQIW